MKPSVLIVVAVVGVALLLGLQLVTGLQLPWLGKRGAGEGRGGLQTVSFPGPFLAHFSGETPGGGGTIIDSLEYELKRLPGNRGGELLFAMKGFDPGARRAVLSRNVYAVSLDGGSRVREAMAAEWEAGEALPRGGEGLSTGGDVETPEGVRYRGKLFPKSGRAWGSLVALPSPRGSRLAVFSHAGGPASVLPPLVPLDSNAPPGEPESGTLFVDIYDTNTGERLASGSSSYSRSPASAFFGRAFWAGDGYFIMPLDVFGQTCLLGLLTHE
ncbi:MAG TPA: hypothetical protein VF611_01050 [Pyrinomonadaceae bacterium]|jgi:hypothetical protein